MATKKAAKTSDKFYGTGRRKTSIAREINLLHDLGKDTNQINMIFLVFSHAT